MYLILTSALWDKYSDVCRLCHWLCTELQLSYPPSGLSFILLWHALACHNRHYDMLYALSPCSCLRVDFDIKITHLFSVGLCFKRSILFHSLPSTFVYPCYSCVPCKQHRTGFRFLIHSAYLYFYLGHLVCLHLPSEPPGKPSRNFLGLQVREATSQVPLRNCSEEAGQGFRLYEDCSKAGR